MAGDGFQRMNPERRRLLVRTAAKEFATMGYERASLNRILRACGLSKSSFYHFIGSKRELFDLVVRDLSGALIEALDIPDPEAFAGDRFWPEVQRLFDSLALIGQRDPAFIELGRMFYVADMAADEAVTESMAAAESWLNQVLDVGRASGAVREDLPISLQSRLVFAVMRAMDEWTLARASDLTPDEAALLVDAELAAVRRLLQPDDRS